MSGINKVILIGRLGKDPEVKFMTSGDAVANISIATSESWKDKTTGEKKEVTEWHNLVFYKRLAEIVGQYLTKGSNIYVEGKLKTRKWTDKNGVDKYTTEIVVNNMQMLDAKGDKPASNNESQNAGNAQSTPQPAAAMAEFDDDIPF